MKSVVFLTGNPVLAQAMTVATEPCGLGLIVGQATEDVPSAPDQALPAAIIIDWLLPEEAGLEACRRLRLTRALRSLPIILLIGSNTEADKRDAIMAGASCVLVAPVGPATIITRLNDMLSIDACCPAPDMHLCAGDLEIDRSAQVVRRSGRVVHLGPIDYRILELLARSPDYLATRDAINQQIWGGDAAIHDSTINIHVARIRKALMAVHKTDPIRTIRGVGYQLVGGDMKRAAHSQRRRGMASG